MDMSERDKAAMSTQQTQILGNFVQDQKLSMYYLHIGYILSKI